MAMPIPNMKALGIIIVHRQRWTKHIDLVSKKSRD